MAISKRRYSRRVLTFCVFFLSLTTSKIKCFFEFCARTLSFRIAHSRARVCEQAAKARACRCRCRRRRRRRIVAQVCLASSLRAESRDDDASEARSCERVGRLRAKVMRQHVAPTFEGRRSKKKSKRARLSLDVWPPSLRRQRSSHAIATCKLVCSCPQHNFLCQIRDAK